VTDLQEQGIEFKSLTEAIDTTTSGGKLVFHIFGALAEFERELIRERTQAGITAACLSIEPVRKCSHESVFEGPEAEGAGRGGPRDA
jgi:hypothetical protein